MLYLLSVGTDTKFPKSSAFPQVDSKTCRFLFIWNIAQLLRPEGESSRDPGSETEAERVHPSCARPCKVFALGFLGDSGLAWPGLSFFITNQKIPPKIRENSRPGKIRIKLSQLPQLIFFILTRKCLSEIQILIYKMFSLFTS